jgi:hypothetical protein
MRSASLAILGLAVAGTPLAAAEVDYLRDVKPILRAHCYACHGAARQKAGLRLDAGPLLRKGGRHGPVVVPGKADASLLVQALLGNDRPRMPPESEGAGLAEKEVALLRQWIDQGAKAPDEPIPDDPRHHWAFRAPIRPPVPRVAGTRAGNPVDAFLAAARAGHGLEPNPPASKPVLLRRVTLDLVGVPPTREELQTFLGDEAPDAYEKVVDHLLDSPQYGERWGRHWMDVWRYSDPFGLGEEYRYSQRHVWRWRDWILESLNADKGYDQMILEMLAGDEIAPTDRDTLRATGYLARNWYKFNRNAWIQDTVEYTAAGFLGITLRCARCHDHKYDPFSQREYYEFRAFFEPHDIRIDALPGQPDTAKDGVARAFDGKPDAPTYLFRRGDERLADTSRSLSPGVPAVLGGEVTVQRVHVTPAECAGALGPAVEEARRLARAGVEAAETRAKQATGAGAVLARKKKEAAQAELAAVESRAAAERVRCTEHPDQVLLQVLARAAGRAERQAAALRAEEGLLQAEQSATEARAATADAAGKKLRADAEQKLAAAKKAHADAVAAAGREDPKYTPLIRFDPADSTGRRLALARWITDRHNPLTARVAVNHIWMRHFGRPLVATVANFGLAGQKPTHPELLDYLAVEFMESGWSMKHLHRLLVTSDAYRLGSQDGDAARRALDPDNRWYWRMNSRRMEGEVVRDSILAAAGQLDTTVGGPILDEKLGQTSHRRSVYFRFNTEYKMPFLDQFDPASPSECYERRESVVPQQALALSNSALALNQSRLLPKKLAAAAPGPAAFVAAAFEQVLGRPPTPAERERCERFLREQAELLREPGKLLPFPPAPDDVLPHAADPAQHAREDLIQVLFNHNDFVTIR